ncbi:MAG: minor capsid protein [Ruminococcus sp.]|nr:minor capsid protein [Ruminococcus sp.]
MTDIAIPEEVLIHRCVLNRYKNGGVFGKGELEESIMLENVRLSAVRKRRADKNGGREEKSGVLYFDCQNSRPEDVEFMGDGYRSEIIFGGESYEVTGVRYIYGLTRLHHLEVILGG